MEKVIVAMSGGVDLSVAAALLKEQGYNVSGMMLRLWSETGREESNRCCSPNSMALARRAAARLEIPFHVIDAREEFHSSVVQYFLDGYSQGLTPNPCVICNKVIKWGFLLEHALALGADFLATGHYAKKRAKQGEGWQLLRSTDAVKDQSYVLHVLTQEKLSKALFPVGDHPKAEIRKLAEEFKLPSTGLAESQDLCFLAGEDYREFLQRHAPKASNPGPILTDDGKILGEHRGLAFYTIGQRKGLGITSAQPLYVLRKEAGTNSLVVGLEGELGQSALTAGDVNWISGTAPSAPFQAMVKTRYTSS